MATRLEDIQPGEVSLVKRGANRRRFLLAKNGEVELDETIAKLLEDPAANEGAILDAVRKVGGDEEVVNAVSGIARLWDALPAEIRKAMKPQLADAEDENDDGADEENEDGSTDYDELAKAEQPIYKRDFTAAQRKALAAKGHALPDGSYPIETKADIGPALTLARSGHGDSAKAMALIKRRAKELGAEDQLPDDLNKEATDMTDTATVPVKKEDGTWDLSGVPEDQRSAFADFIAKQDAEYESIRKEAEEQKTIAEQALAKSDAVEAQLAKAAHIDAAKGYDNLAKSADELGELLYDIAKAENDEHLPKGTSDKLTELLKAANEAAADVFKEAGRVGQSHGNSDLESRVTAKADEIRKADPDLTEQQAIAKAYEQNPDLYNEYQKAVA